MRYRFDKAAFFHKRVKYGYAPPLAYELRSAPTPGEGAKRQYKRLYDKIAAHPEIEPGEPSRQVLRAQARRAAKIARRDARA